METFEYKGSIVEYDIDDLVSLHGQAEELLAGILHPDVFNDKAEWIGGLEGAVACTMVVKIDDNIVEMQSLMKAEIYDNFGTDKKGRIELIEFVLETAINNFYKL